MVRKRHVEPLGPANDEPVQVTQELVALFYMDNPTAVAPLLRSKIFHDGMTDRPAPEPSGEDDVEGNVDLAIWEAGALAAHLIAIGGQE